MTDTPKNREELVGLMADVIEPYLLASSADKEVAAELKQSLESHGVRLVPVEATEEMVNELYFSDDLIWERSDESKWIAWTDWPRAYRVTLSASPFRPDTGDES